MISRQILLTLFTLGCTLPVALTILLGTGRLLFAMGDAAGARFVDLVSLVVAAVWMSSLVLLILSLGLNAVATSPLSTTTSPDDSPAPLAKDSTSAAEQHAATHVSPTVDSPASE